MNQRKEQRFKTNSDHHLHCRTTIDEPGLDQSRDGIAIDISASGIRLLTEGSFHSGQTIRVELITNESHGVYRARVLRLESWTGGQSILGCSLQDTIPNEVLARLANEGVINRRTDGRFRIAQPATVRWPNCAETLQVELRDYSSGGMKLWSSEPIPDDVRLRLSFERGGKEVALIARSVWTRPSEGGWVSGIAFTTLGTDAIVADAMGEQSSDATEPSSSSDSSNIRHGTLTLTALIAVGGYLMCHVM